MRVLFCSSGGAGHLRPMLPLAAAVRRQGHRAAWVTSPDALSEPAALEIECFPARLTVAAARESYRRRWPESTRLSGEALSAHTYPRLFGAVVAPAMRQPLDEAVAAWQPDLVVSEVAALAAPLVCAIQGIPHWTHGIGLPQPPGQLREAARLFAGLWTAAALPAPDDGGVYRHLYLDIAPPSLCASVAPAEGESQRISPAPGGLPVRWPLPPALRSMITHAGRPRIYLSFGTVFNVSDALVTAIRALSRLQALVIVTTGLDRASAEFGRLPPNVHVERFVDQSELLPLCDAVVSHGGAGTVLGACAFALPQLVLPQAADQFRNARALSACGAARVIEPGGLTEDAICAAAQSMLASSGMRSAARRLALEVAAMPSPQDAVDRMQRTLTRARARTPATGTA